MQVLTNILEKWTLSHKLLINIAIAGLLLFLVFIFKYPIFFKNTAYSCTREAVKKSVYLKTWDWDTLESPHFTLKYQPTEGNVAQLILSTAETAFQPVNNFLEFTPEGKIPVIVYPTQEQMNKSFGWDADENAMGVYWAGVIRILSPNDWVSDSSLLAEEFSKNGPMAHEYTHLVVDYLTKGNYPRWLTEGIAQYVEREVTGFQFPVPVVQGNDNNLYSLTQLDKQYDSLPNQSLAYGQSLAAIDYYIETCGVESLRNLLADLSEGKTIQAAIAINTGQSLEDFEQCYQKWSNNKYFLQAN
ncbi:peptidase MA family metallohydrolase [Bacillota bacterium LX-D]|nr:peptidase MA family metallohydrolase [Bacillota bacterium LX-D]